MSDSSFILAMIVMHVLVDFFIQPTAWVQDRGQQHWRSRALYYHGACHFIGSGLVLWLWSALSWSDHSGWTLLASALVLAVSHLLIDGVKSYYHSLSAFIWDQLLHLCVILLLCGLLLEQAFIQSMLLQVIEPGTLLLLLGYLLLLKPSSVVIRTILNHTHLHRASAVTPPQQSSAGAPAAGHWIGVTERLLVLTLILLGHYSAVGFVIAAKSVLRFNDLRDNHDRALTEYILLGSLLSFGVTIAVAILLQSQPFGVVLPSLLSSAPLE